MSWTAPNAGGWARRAVASAASSSPPLTLEARSASPSPFVSKVSFGESKKVTSASPRLVPPSRMAAARARSQELYIYQCTADTRPEDLLITPVLSQGGEISYHASPLVSAMITGGVCLLDEGNRMNEKSWASLAPLLDQRRYVESLSNYARQFMGQMPKPDVDLVSGLSPSVSISQKSSGNNPRSRLAL